MSDTASPAVREAGRLLGIAAGYGDFTDLLERALRMYAAEPREEMIRRAAAISADDIDTVLPETPRALNRAERRTEARRMRRCGR